MTITPGTRFGPFEILDALGAGGMGEVYRARDTRLHREVALKLLPKDLAHDAERVGRLTREARLLASLSHPHIAAIHGIEEHDGEMALVLELVEGPTLADRLLTGALPVGEALTMARQVAEAMEAAHARGVIHRDLKPSNLKVTTDGNVKVLDFGIAKALADESVTPPNVTAPSLATTRTGVVIGTPGYMSPEQMTGGSVDRRTDVWAFGCLVFEALTGRPAFDGATASEKIVRVLEHEPDWGALPRNVPPELEHLLARCLRKDARQRLQDIGDARVELEELQSGRERTTAERARSRRLTRHVVLPWALSAGLGIAALLLLLWKLRTPLVTTIPAHLAVQLPAGVVLPMDTEHPVLALSPDGTRLVFVGEVLGMRRLYLRDLADPDARPVDGTEGAASPFFSPDGAWIGFVAGLTMKKVAVSGGLPVPVQAVTPTTVNRGATWVTTDSVVYAASPNSGLTQASVAGEQRLAISQWAYITVDVTAPYAWPHSLPGGRDVLFSEGVADSSEQSRVSVLSRRSRAITTLISGGTNPRYSHTGHLLFARGGSLYAIPFDAQRARTTGSEQQVLDGVMTESNGAAHFAVSANGTLVYVAGVPVTRQRELVWVDRQSRVETLLDNGREFSFPRLSPDGARLAVTSPTGSNYDVWMLNIARKALQRVTTDPGEDFEPVWSPDGARLAFSSEGTQEDEGPGLSWTVGADYRLEHLMSTPGIGNWEFPTSWSPDGKWLAYTRDRAGAASDIELLPTSGARTPVAFVASPAAEAAAMFSPDGRFIAYVSDESGREEVWVQPFPGPGAREQVSTNGGTEPVWSRDRRELYYREGNKLMAVRLGDDATFDPGSPSVLFEGRYDKAPYGGRSANYDVSVDGRRFVMVRRKNLPEPTTIHVVFNWPKALGSANAASKPGGD